MHDAGKIFVKTCLKAIRDMWYFYPTEEESLNF